MNTLDTLFTTLDSYFQGVKEQGISRIPWQGPLLRHVPGTDTPAPKPRQQVTQARTIPKAKEPPSLPAAKTEPVVKPAEAGTPALRYIFIDRLPECGDGGESTRIALVVEPGELEEPNRKLLTDMLRAIGYGMTSPVEVWEADISLSGRAARVLAMGNTPLQTLSTAGMDLQIVRGMWQQSPHGKLLSTFAPSYLQENRAGKKAAWGDLQKLLKDLDLSLPDWVNRKQAGT